MTVAPPPPPGGWGTPSPIVGGLLEGPAGYSCLSTTSDKTLDLDFNHSQRCAILWAHFTFVFLLSYWFRSMTKCVHMVLTVEQHFLWHLEQPCTGFALGCLDFLLFPSVPPD